MPIKNIEQPAVIEIDDDIRLLKYNGDYDWEYDSENKVFTATVMISKSGKNK